MKISILAYYFYPDINPRSFRAFELAKEFSRSGHRVSVFVADFGYDYSNLEAKYGFRVVKVKPGFFLNKRKTVQMTRTSTGAQATVNIPAGQKKSLLRRLKIAFTRMFLPGGFNFEFAWTCAKALRAETEKPDLLISIGLPINVHVAAAKASRWRKYANTMIADYGDPYSFSRIINPPYFHRWLERRMLRKFDYVMTPTAKAIPAFRYFKPEQKIKVIPQAFNMTDVRRAEKTPCEIITFVFAGNFYKGIREPDELFKFLAASNLPFRFRLFINDQSAENMALIAPYRDALGERLEINPIMDREACIYEMSKADFLVNVSNITDEHSPSKLIDYCLAQRPIFSYTPGKFDAQQFSLFMQRDFRYDIAGTIDISEFDIQRVTSQILDLTRS